MLIARDGAWQHDGETLALRAGRRPARRRRRVPGAARPVRRGRHRPGPARAARRALRRRGRARLVAVHGQGRLQGGAGAPPACRRSRYAGRARAALAARPGRRARASSPRSACRCSSSRRGSAPRSGIAKVTDAGRARRRARERVRARRARDRRGVLATASRSSARCSATTSRRPRVPGEIVAHGRRLVRLRGQVRAGRRWSSSCRRGSPTPRAERVRRLARRDVPARRLRRPRARRLLRRGRARARQRAQHDAGLHADERLPEAVGGDRRAVPRARATACSASRSSASRAERGGHAF